MRCPNCGLDSPPPVSSDNGTTTCWKCGHRFAFEEPLTRVIVPRRNPPLAARRPLPRTLRRRGQR